MGLEAIVVAEVIPATPERIYQAWMDAKDYAA